MFYISKIYLFYTQVDINVSEVVLNYLQKFKCKCKENMQHNHVMWQSLGQKQTSLQLWKSGVR